jgi:DNA (cytosine-5)-methyltransferase 1
MKYGSVCSGIEAATVAWEPLGWKAAFFSEIESFPRAVLAHHYPNVPLHGDFTTIKGSEYEPIDLLVGGTPCQSFSVAGLRGGLDDDRGNLALEFLRLADRTRPRWLVWENVPGVLSSNGGRDFGSILGGMVELGYGIAYRVLDAQYFGVAQRRRRVFVVGYLADWRRAAAVLFERHSLQGHSPPRREKGQKPAGTIEASLGRSRGAGTPIGALSHWDGPEHPHPTLNQSHNAGGVGQSNQEIFSQRGAYLAPDVSYTLNAGGMKRQDYESETFLIMNAVAGPLDSHYGKGPGSRAGGEREFVAQITGTLNANGKAAGSATQQDAETGMLIAFHAEAQADQLPTAGRDTSISDSLTTSQHAAVAFEGDVARTLSARHDGSPCADRGPNVVAVQHNMQVRRLTPRECERLQGFPDDYTLIPHRNKAAADGPRYKALGNSMAVPVMRWIGERIQMVDCIPLQDKEYPPHSEYPGKKPCH